MSQEIRTSTTTLLHGHPCDLASWLWQTWGSQTPYSRTKNPDENVPLDRQKLRFFTDLALQHHL